jgi:hypothetical protein
MYIKGYLLREGVRNQKTAYYGTGRLRDLVLKAT